MEDKENYATNLCKGDIVAQWDDDDIALPNHLYNINKYFINSNLKRAGDLSICHLLLYFITAHKKGIGLI